MSEWASTASAVRLAEKSYRNLLIHYFESKKQKLCIDCKKRLETNPLRILDCKEDKCVQVKANAPNQLIIFAMSAERTSKSFLNISRSWKFLSNLIQRLCEGLDYYTKTVFEFFPATSDRGEPDSASREGMKKKCSWRRGKI